MRTRLSITAAVIAAAGGVVPVVASASADAAPVNSWNRLAQCESGGRWHVNTGNGYYGGLQFSNSTWRGFGGGRFAPRADIATKAQQIQIAERVQHSQGWQAWPVCSHRVGLR